MAYRPYPQTSNATFVVTRAFQTEVGGIQGQRTGHSEKREITSIMTLSSSAVKLVRRL
jgi:hypothetical protein